MKIVRLNLTAVLLILSLPVGSPSAGDLRWPCRNGPFQTGCATEPDARGVPIEWDESSGKNIAWKLELEGLGHSTPVIGDGRIWFTAATEDGKQQFVYAIDAGAGRIVHHKLLFENAAPEPLGNRVNTYASPSCVLEEDAVYVHFGTYGTARLDAQTAGIVWQRRDLHCRHYRGPGSSPIVWQNLLILTFDGIDQQYVTALDKRTGKTVWRTDRSTNYHDLGPDGKPKLEGDVRKGYGTPGERRSGPRSSNFSRLARRLRLRRGDWARNLDNPPQRFQRGGSAAVFREPGDHPLGHGRHEFHGCPARRDDARRCDQYTRCLEPHQGKLTTVRPRA
jgi:hypothetical protein